MRTTIATLLVAAALAACAPIPGWMVAQGRSTITDYQHFANAPLAKATQPSPLPAALAPVRWPADYEEGYAQRWLAEQGTVALIMVRRGEIIAERYYNGYSRDSVFTSFSMAKSVVSTLIGIAQAEGRIGSLEDPITRYLPELRGNDPRFDRITLRHLLRMRSGIAFEESYGSPFSEAGRFYLTDDMKSEVAKLRIEREPDQAYRYSSGDTQLLGMALERAVGQPLPAYAQEKLWQPMGAEYDASWSLDKPGGAARAFCCLNARAIDYMRLGMVFLNEGRWNGRQIVPAAWVRESTAAHDSLPGADDDARRNIERRGNFGVFYGLQWRRVPVPGSGPSGALQPGADFFAQGLHGQVLYVAPGSQTVVLRLGQRSGEVYWPRWLSDWVRLNP